MPSGTSSSRRLAAYSDNVSTFEAGETGEPARQREDLPSVGRLRVRRLVW